MLTARPLPSRPGGTQLRHVHEVVEASDDGRIIRTPVLDFLNSLSEVEQHAMYARFELLERAGFFGQPAWKRMGNWFKRLEHVGDVWEVGDDNRVRFYGFRGGAGLLLTNGSKKRGKKTPRADLNKCIELRETFQRQGHG